MTYDKLFWFVSSYFFPDFRKKYKYTLITRCNQRLPLARALKRQQPETLASEPTPVVCQELRRSQKDQDQVAQNVAFQELMVLQYANGGKIWCRDIQTIVNKYSSMGLFVTRNNLDYLFDTQKNGAIAVSAAKLTTIVPAQEVTTNLESG
jgi:hypothetical protein